MVSHQFTIIAHLSCLHADGQTSASFLVVYWLISCSLLPDCSEHVGRETENPTHRGSVKKTTHVSVSYCGPVATWCQCGPVLVLLSL